MKRRRKTLIKRLLAGTGALLLFASSCCFGLLIRPVKTHAFEHIDWPLTWEFDHVNVVGETHSENLDGSRLVDFGDGFIKFTEVDHDKDGKEVRDIVEYSYQMPQTISVGNESEMVIPFFLNLTDRKHFFCRDYNVYWEMVYIGENTGDYFGDGGFGISDSTLEHMKAEDLRTLNFDMGCGDMLVGGLDMWAKCYMTNGALRNEESCREFAECVRLRIVVDPYEFYELGDKNCYVMYSYRMNLGNVSFIEPLGGGGTSQKEENDNSWTVNEDTSNASTEKGSDEGVGIKEDIVEGDDKKKDSGGDDDNGWWNDSGPLGSLDDWSGGGLDDISSWLSDNDNENLPSTIAISVGGAAIAAGAGAAAGGGATSATGSAKKTSENSKKNEEKKQQKKKNEKYRLYVSKDFGDALEYSSPPKNVYARIVQVLDSGGEKPRADLYGSIKVSSKDGNLIVNDGGISANGKCAIISVPENSKSSKGTVTFRFEGKGGIFTKNVIFRLTGEPYIVFPDMGAGSAAMVLKVISNDPGVNSCRFFFEDAIGEPIKLTFSADERFSIKARPAENVRTYYADVVFKSGLETTSAYADLERVLIGIHAEFENKAVVESTFYVEIWPEGLSVFSRHVKNDRLMIDTVPDPNAGDLDYVIRPTGFDVRLCYREASAGGSEPVFMTGEDLEPKFGELYQVEKYGNTFTDNFKYSIDTRFNEYGFEPKNTLPMIKNPYEAMIDMTCIVEGKEYRKELPLGFYGEKPLLPSDAQWQEVYKKLKRAVAVFGLGNDPDIKTMFKNARTASAADLEYLRYWIILSGMNYYQRESEEYAKIDKVMTNYIVVASALVKIGDKAVEVAIKLKWPQADAALIAAFVNPWKNAMAQFIGQYVAKWSWVDLAEGNPEDFEFMQTLLSSCEGTLSEIITSDEIMVEPKIMGQIVSLYLMICFAKHYFYGEGNEKGDIFKSTVEALKDLTLTKLKSFFKSLLDDIGEQLGKVADFVGKYLGKTLKYVAFGKADELAKLAYEHQVRMAIQNQGELSNAAYEAAKKFSSEVKDLYLNAVGQKISEYGSEAMKWTAKYVLGFILNYLAKGTKKENESLGVETNEVIIEWVSDRSDDILKALADWLKRRFGLDIEKYYMDAAAALDISVRLNGEYLVMAFCGYTVEINIVENAEALFGIAYEACFGWMEDLWKSMQSQDPKWDPRDDLSDDTTMVERMAERVKNLGSSAEIKYTDV